MKYYSEKLNRMFDTAEELEKTEAEVVKQEEAQKAKENELKTKRAERAKEVEAAYKAVHEAEKKANKLMEDFLKDYGSYHTTIKEVIPSLYDLFTYLIG